jgi:hypothetical protein
MYVVGKAAGVGVVLAMHVSSDSSSDGYQHRARNYWQHHHSTTRKLVYCCESSTSIDV